MISDAPYQTTDRVLSLWGGITAGFMSALLMLAVILALGSHAQVTIREVLRAIGTIVPMTKALPESLVLVTGGLVHLGLGALFGALYAVCQQRTPMRGLITVGVFYGFVLWLVSNLLTHPLFPGALRSLVHSRTWLLASLCYGLGLGIAAALSAGRSSLSAMVALPKD